VSAAPRPRARVPHGCETLRERYATASSTTAGRVGSTTSHSAALAIANTDRVRREYPTTVEGVRPFVEAFLDAPVIPIFSGQGTPGAGRMAFDFVFQVLARDVEHWSEGSLVPEKAPGVVDLRIGVPIPLANIPGLADLFGATGPRKQSP